MLWRNFLSFEVASKGSLKFKCIVYPNKIKPAALLKKVSQTGIARATSQQVIHTSQGITFLSFQACRTHRHTIPLIIEITYFLKFEKYQNSKNEAFFF